MSSFLSVCDIVRVFLQYNCDSLGWSHRYPLKTGPLKAIYDTSKYFPQALRKTKSPQNFPGLSASKPSHVCHFHRQSICWALYVFLQQSLKACLSISLLSLWHYTLTRIIQSVVHAGRRGNEDKLHCSNYRTSHWVHSIIPALSSSYS